ncbi:MAG TPA: DUF2844 domain-containing protein [Terriglobia bacterium]|jgi:hypothetical protein|nr:DUF2844 domain-containing protein [Terriglobia bacterium]
MKILGCTLVCILLLSAPGWAVLGEYENSIALDQQHMRAQLHQTSAQGYSVNELTTPEGKRVREFVSAKGMVFGVAWRGPTLPDLRQLLGTYFSQVQQAAQPRRRRGGPLVIKTKDFILVSGGHMRAFHGFAYVPSLLPAGVSAEVVR